MASAKRVMFDLKLFGSSRRNTIARASRTWSECVPPFAHAGFLTETPILSAEEAVRQPRLQPPILRFEPAAQPGVSALPSTSHSLPCLGSLLILGTPPVASTINSVVFGATRSMWGETAWWNNQDGLCSQCSMVRRGPHLRSISIRWSGRRIFGGRLPTYCSWKVPDRGCWTKG